MRINIYTQEQFMEFQPGDILEVIGNPEVIGAFGRSCKGGQWEVIELPKFVHSDYSSALFIPANNIAKRDLELDIEEGLEASGTTLTFGFNSDCKGKDYFVRIPREDIKIKPRFDNIDID